MDSRIYLPLDFVDICEHSLYFKEAESDTPDLNEDGFQKSKSNTCVYIQNREHKFLTICGDGFQVEDLDSVERQKPVYKFHAWLYKNSSINEGNPVMIYVEYNGKKLMVCCCDDGVVAAKQMELPKNIGDGGHEALFYRIPVSGDMYKFKSTKYPRKYLGFDYDKHNLYKLMLIEPVDQVDERCNILQPHTKGVITEDDTPTT